MGAEPLSSGAAIRLEANVPLPLDGRQAWIVQSGAIALFRLRATAEAPERRRHLIDVAVGEAVLWQPEPAGLDVRMVAIEPAVLAGVSMHESVAATASPDAAVRVQRWIAILNREIEAAGLEACVWPQPAPDAAGVQALLARAQEQFLLAVDRIDAAEEVGVRDRFHARQQFNVAVASATLEGLASIGDGSVQGQAAATEPGVVAVMRELGARCGIAVRVPAGREAASVTVQQMLDASGARGRTVTLTDDWWRHDGDPLMATIEATGEPVGLVPVRRRWFRGVGYQALSGASPPQDVDEALAGRVARSATAIYAPIAETSTMAMVRWALSGSGRDLFTAWLSGVAVVVLGMMTPLASKILVETTIPDGDRRGLVELGLVLLAAAAGSLLFDLARSLSFLRLASGAAARLQLGLWDRLLDQGPSFFKQYTAGDLQSRVEAVTQIRAVFNITTLSAILGAAASLLNLGLLLAYSPALTLVALAVAAILAAVTVGSALRVRRLLGTLQDSDGHLHGLLIQLIGAIPKLRIAGAEARAFAQWGRAYAVRMTMAQRLRRTGDRVRLVGIALPALATAALYWFTASDTASGAPRLSLGEFIAFTTAFGTFLAGVTTLASSTELLLGVAAMWARLKPILDAAPEVVGQKNPPGRLTGRLRLDHVTFRYRPDGPLTLDNVSIQAEPGECIALVGPSGSGKSTIVNLLLRFEAPASGAVYLDEHDLRGLDVLAVRQQMGVVSQENKILAGTIYDNVASGSLASHDQVWEAARAAGIEDEIRQMPMGLHTVVSEGGTNLSGGQRQRLLIARVLLRKPSIMILDEATSALDNTSQAIVTASLNRLEVTRVIIAHRLSTIRQADRIYVIEAGRVVQHGAFDELMGQDGLFARLMKRQVA